MSHGNDNFAMFGKLTIGCFGVFGLLAVMSGCFVVGAMNQEVRLRNTVEAQQQVCAADFDKMWKTIAQKVQVSDQYKESFKEIYPQLIAGRYGNEKGGSLMKWVQESNPTFDTSLYRDLMATIEGLREGFYQNQRLLIDKKRQHDTLLQSFPQSILLAGRQPVEIQLILSDRTEDAMRTGQDNDVELFNEQKP